MKEFYHLIIASLCLGKFIPLGIGYGECNPLTPTTHFNPLVSMNGELSEAVTIGNMKED